MAEHPTRTLADLKDLAQTVRARARDRAADAQARPPGPGLCDRAAQGRGRPGLGQAGGRPGDHQRPRHRDLFARPVLRMIINQPFVVASRVQQFDVVCTVKGGGLSGQAGAVRHGISRALVAYDPMLRPPLKAGGYLTRDLRRVERKKYGKRKARRSFQFSKR